jgi:hypothetical protein
MAAKVEKPERTMLVHRLEIDIDKFAAANGPSAIPARVRARRRLRRLGRRKGVR